MSNGGFSFKKLYEDSKKALFQPKEYFSSMEIQGGLGDPILKVLVYGAIAGVFALLWSLFNISGFTGGILGGAIGIAAFFWSIVGAVIGVFIGGVIILIISSICNGNGNFEPNMRVAAAIMVILPINAFLGFFGGISYALDAIIGFAVNLYAVYMLYIAVTTTLEGKVQPAKAISYILGGLLVVFLIINLFAGHKY
ncbi:MAG: Yip1 family protein, partial [Bacteroidales bacterium]